MPLISKDLKDALIGIQKAPPATIADAANLWSAAIQTYSSVGLAGAGVPTLAQPALQAAFLSSMSSQTFIDDLGKNLAAYWQAAVWAVPGGTGATIPPTPLDSASIGKKIMSGEVSDFTGYLSDEIDKWTKTIKVTLVVGPTTSIVPVT